LYFILSTVVAIGLVIFLFPYLQSNPDNPFDTAIKTGRKISQQGRKGTPACTVCHGVLGEGDWKLGYPRLAGLHPDYIRKQLQDFGRDPLDIGVKIDAIARDYTKTPRIYKDLTVYSPGIRSDAIMNQIAKILIPEDIDVLVEYYARLPFKAKPVAADFQALENGLELAIRGKPEYMMPRCNACHGPNGEGFGAIFPPLSGQPQKYITDQINKWQRGERDNDNLSVMKNVANLLTDGDKKNIATYFNNISYEVN